MSQGYPIRVYRGVKANMPAGVAVGTPLLATDTMQLFFGGGPNVPSIPMKMAVADVTGLLVNGKLNPNLAPPIAVTSVIEVANQAARDALVFGNDGDIQAGDFVNVLNDHDDNDGNSVSQLYLVTNNGGFTPVGGLGGGGGGITSVNNMAGPAVVLTTDNIDEGGTRLYYTDQRVARYLAGVINKANGIAGLDANGKLSIDLLPSSVVRQGDDATRLAAGTAANPQPSTALLGTDGAGKAKWVTEIDGGEF